MLNRKATAFPSLTYINLLPLGAQIWYCTTTTWWCNYTTTFPGKKQSLRSFHFPAWPKSPVPMSTPQFTSCLLVLMQLAVGLCGKLGQGNIFWIAVGLWLFFFNFGSFHFSTKSCLSTTEGAMNCVVQCQEQVAKGGGKAFKLLLLLGKTFM